MRSNKELAPAAPTPRAKARKNGDQTRRRILAAAEVLFAQQGVRATSLRAIARAADVHQPSLHYHFRDKAALFRATLELHVVPLYARRLEALEAIEAAGRGDDLDAILRAGQRPILEAWSRPIAPGVTVVSLIYRAIVDADPEWDAVAEEISLPVRERYVAAFQRALPGLSREELLERLNFVQGALAGLYLDRSEDEMNRPWRGLHADLDAFEDRIVALCKTVLAAPPFGSPAGTRTDRSAS